MKGPRENGKTVRGMKEGNPPHSSHFWLTSSKFPQVWRRVTGWFFLHGSHSNQTRFSGCFLSQLCWERGRKQGRWAEERESWGGTTEQKQLKSGLDWMEDGVICCFQLLISGTRSSSINNYFTSHLFGLWGDENCSPCFVSLRSAIWSFAQISLKLCAASGEWRLLGDIYL